MAPRAEELAPQPSPPRLALEAGIEPLAGYRLIEPLGSGGFGEVWKCEVPGGLFKAIKFVGAGGNGQTEDRSLASRELEALEKVKAIRHPFLLSMERVEVLEGVLMIVMELADKNLQCVLLEHQEAGMSGIPRDELLGFMEEAAEALDVLNFQHGLQHLDVKPHNLFVVSNHIKVGDFGLVNGLPTPGQEHHCGAAGTPLYAAPEVLQNSFSRQSDQYSLAIVYQQLLTGTVPFWSPKAYHLVMQHLTGKPNLAALPDHDQAAMAKALAKDPEQRYPSCLDFVQALHQAKPAESAGIRRSGLVRIVRPNKPAQATSAVGTPVPGSLNRTPPQLERTVILPVASPSLSPAVSKGADDGLSRRPGNDNPTQFLPSIVPVKLVDSAAMRPIPGSTTTSLGLPGFRFLTCLGQSPLVDLWTVQDPVGKERLAQCIIGTRASERVVERLRELRHAALPELEVFSSVSGRTVLVSDLGRLTLRDRFEECQAQGLPGIPRDQLLTYLIAAATALDELQEEQGLQHLGLNPSNLLIQGDKVLLGDFGLIPLIWIPAGNSAAQLNARYAAPELIEPVSTTSADQYSLALIFTEMLSGIYPRLKSAGNKSGLSRRRGHLDARSGSYRRGDMNGGRTRHAITPSAKVDLDLLPSSDRPIIARALADDPDERFESCRELVQALAAASMVPKHTQELYTSLPLVIPFASLLGQPPPSGTVLPQPETLVAELMQLGHAVQVLNLDNARYLVHADGSWEYRCPTNLFSRLLKLKLEGFRQHWGAQLVREDGPLYHFRVNGEASGQRTVGRMGQPRLAGVEVRLQLVQGHGPGATTQIREAVVRIGPCGGDRSGVPELAPRLFQSLRAFLQGAPEQRAEERYPFTQTFHVYPVLPDLELAGVLEARGRNISRGGMQFLVTDKPASDHFFLHFRESPKLASLALLARATRVVPVSTGQYEIGATFSIDGPRNH